MTLEQLIATKPGDRLRGPQGWCGEIVDTTRKGVAVHWRHPKRNGNTMRMNFSHPEWKRVELDDKL